MGGQGVRKLVVMVKRLQLLFLSAGGRVGLFLFLCLFVFFFLSFFLLLPLSIYVRSLWHFISLYATSKVYYWLGCLCGGVGVSEIIMFRELIIHVRDE